MRHKAERGMSLIELMIAMLVLAIGLAGITILLTTAMASNNRNSRDTTATLLAQTVIEQISAQHVYADDATTPITITDCANNNWTVASAPGAAGTGAGASLTANGTIDFTQSYANIPANYAMQYVDCSTAGGIPTTYEVRWNVMSVSTNTTSRLIIAAARPQASKVKQLGGLFYALPVNLRSIGAPAAGE